MVFCTPAAVGAVVGSSAGAGATALGLKMDKQSVDLTRDAYLQQMRQSKRLFTAQWVDASYRHGETVLQSAQQHEESQALAKAQYFQAERIHSEDMKLSRDQDTRAFEMSWRAEARESLRDELTNQFNRYNIIMLADTVCLGCIMPLVESGSPPEETSQTILALYLLSMGSSIMLFVVSLWFCVIVVRRLHEHTASVLERKLFANTEELQKVWVDQIENDLPTTTHVMTLLNQAYQEWLAQQIQPLGNASIQLLTYGVFFLFVTAGLLTHARYLIDYDSPVAVSMFWTTVSIASILIFSFKYREDRYERLKKGCYDKSWMDKPNTIGPMAKISNSTQQLFNATAVRLGSSSRREQYKQREKTERGFIAKTEALHAKSASLLTEAEKRGKVKRDVLEALTAAAEELDVLPEDLIARVNDMIHEAYDLDKKTTAVLSMPSAFSENDTDVDEEDSTQNMPRNIIPMQADPIDANRTTVSLTSLRAKLGETLLTTLIRIRNLSEEPLRLRSGVHLKEGHYFKEIDVVLLSNRRLPGSKVSYHLFPIEEIPPRTEVVIAARSSGTNWIPTSGINGELVFANKHQTWTFHIQFSNSLSRGDRTCKVNAVQVGSDTNKSVGKWRISHETIDHLNNHEVFVSIDKRRSAGISNKILDSVVPISQPLQKENGNPLASQPAITRSIDSTSISWMEGFLFQQIVGLQAFWQRKWCTLTSRALTGDDGLEILLKDVTKVRAIPNGVRNYVFDVFSTQRKPVRFAASTMAERDKWIRGISDAKGRDVTDWGSHKPIPIEIEKTGLGNTMNEYKDLDIEDIETGYGISNLAPNDAASEESRKNGRKVLSIEQGGRDKM